MSRVIAKIEAFKPDDHSVEECLLELEKYGKPHITKGSGYWWSGIDVFVNGTGVSFEVKFSQAKTPREAVNGVHARLMETMRKIKET